MISGSEQSHLDIDWFFTDGDHIGFVASGGGKLPQHVAKSKDNIQLLSSYFRALRRISDIVINPKLDVLMGDRKANDDYLSDFIFMSEKGLYSFDKTTLNDFSDCQYHLVTSPVKPLSIAELPTEILDVLLETVNTKRNRYQIDDLLIL